MGIGDWDIIQNIYIIIHVIHIIIGIIFKYELIRSFQKEIL